MEKPILSDKALFLLIADLELGDKLMKATVQFTQEMPNITDENNNVLSALKKPPVRVEFDNLTRELLEIVGYARGQ